MSATERERPPDAPETRASEVFSGPLGEQLLRRTQRAIADARALLGIAERDVVASEDPRAALAELSARLSAAAPNEAAAVRDDHDAALERLRQRYDSRFQALADAQAAVAELREITSPGAMLARAPAALCEHSALERAILSLVRRGRMTAEAAHFAGQSAAARAVLEQLRSNPLRLEHPLIETELLRRRRATIVLDAQVHPRVDRGFAELMGWEAYAAAPLVIGGQVIGVIHADRGPRRHIDVLDRDVLWEFTSGLAQAYESASLRRTLRGERDQMRQFLEWLGARSGELTDAPVRLASGPRTPPAPPEQLDQPSPPEGRDDRVVFEGLLTRRELEVLRLLADGHTNRAIADALVISPGTVKFHVNSVLRKLHAANRAEAVSRYLRLLGMRTP
jgi:LuxR family transcriptional regulator, regulator of acetate metabolism